MITLNSPQQEAIKYIDGPLLVLAGAGSGKTSVITQKIAHLIENCGISANLIFAVTFTNKAAKEMYHRTSALIHKNHAKDLNISTFHNLGLQIIRTEYSKLGYKSSFSIFDDADVKCLLDDIIKSKSLNDSIDVEDIRSNISRWKNNLATPEQLLVSKKNPKDLELATIYKHYQHLLKCYNAVDFDDLVLLPVRLFDLHKDVLKKWQDKIGYLLVDEYQDTNIIQYSLIKHFTCMHNRFTVVGDDDQSIYGWRGASPENITYLKQEYPKLKVIVLEQNYRSTARILRCANLLIDHNKHTFKKKLWSNIGTGEKTQIVQCSDEESEARWVVSKIITLKENEKASYSDFAILYRANHQSRVIELELRQQQIPYSLSSNNSFFARKEIKDLIAYLRLIVNPENDSAFIRIVNIPNREVGCSTLEKLTKYANNRNLSIYDILDEIGLRQFLSDRLISRLLNLKKIIDEIRVYCKQKGSHAALRMVIARTSYEDWILRSSTAGRISKYRIDNIWVLVNLFESFFKSKALSLEEALNKIIMNDLSEREQNDQKSLRGIQLMTLHASKGLEFEHVFIVGVEEKILPHHASIESNQFEEERRLAYVGITRARQRLTLTFSAQRTRYQDVIESKPSRFIHELPQEEVEWENISAIANRTNKKNAALALANIRGILKC